MSKTIGVVLIIDTSASMRSSMENVKSFAKGLINGLLENDKFTIVQLNEQAEFIYPATAMQTVSNTRQEILSAWEVINTLYSNGKTDVANAFALIKEKYQSPTTDVKAFVMISDGEVNKGTVPVLNGYPPIHIVGLGDLVQVPNFFYLLKSGSRFYNQSTHEIEAILSYIRSSAPN